MWPNVIANLATMSALNDVLLPLLVWIGSWDVCACVCVCVCV